MRALHAVALVLCALAPPTWIAVAVALLVLHGANVTALSADDWAVLGSLLVGLPLLAAVLLRVPPPRIRRTPVLRLSAPPRR